MPVITDSEVLISGDDIYGIVRVRGGIVVEVDEGLEFMLGKAWREVFCWNRIKSFEVR